MIRINLLPVRVSKRKLAGRQQLVLFGLVLALGIILNSLWTQARAHDLENRRAKLKRTRDDIAQLERIIGEVKNIKDEQTALKQKLAVLEKLKAGRAGPVHVLDELATVVPKRVELRKLEEKGGTVLFEGSAGSYDDVSAFMSALKGSRYFGAVELQKTAAAVRSRFKVVDFTVTAAVNYVPAQVAAAARPGAAQR